MKRCITLLLLLGPLFLGGCDRQPGEHKHLNITCGQAGQPACKEGSYR